MIATREIRSAQRGRLRIGANQSIGEYVLPRLTRTFQERYPGIVLRIVIGYSDAMLASLRRGDVDVALVADRPKDKDMEVRPLMMDRLVAILNPQHKLANHDAIGLEALGTESVILLTEASELRDRVVEIFRRFGVPLNIRVETETLDSVKRMVAENMGIGIVPSLCVTRDDSDHLVTKTIQEFQEDRPLWIVQPAASTPACRLFVGLLTSEPASLR